MSEQQDAKPPPPSRPDPAMAVFSKIFGRIADEAIDPEEKAYNSMLSKKAAEAAQE